MFAACAKRPLTAGWRSWRDFVLDLLAQEEAARRAFAVMSRMLNVQLSKGWSRWKAIFDALKADEEARRSAVVHFERTAARVFGSLEARLLTAGWRTWTSAHFEALEAEAAAAQAFKVMTRMLNVQLGRGWPRWRQARRGQGRRRAAARDAEMRGLQIEAGVKALISRAAARFAADAARCARRSRAPGGRGRAARQQGIAVARRCLARIERAAESRRSRRGSTRPPSSRGSRRRRPSIARMRAVFNNITQKELAPAWRAWARAQRLAAPRARGGGGGGGRGAQAQAERRMRAVFNNIMRKELAFAWRVGARARAPRGGRRQAERARRQDAPRAPTLHHVETAAARGAARGSRS